MREKIVNFATKWQVDFWHFGKNGNKGLVAQAGCFKGLSPNFASDIKRIKAI